MKIAVLFGGQGAQQVGMGKELYDNFDIVKSTFDQADEILSLDIKKLCFEGPNEELSQTINTQPCMFTFATSVARLLSQHNIDAEYCGGLSLGEYAALTYAGVMSFDNGLRLIRKRGEFMQNALPQGVGAMAAVLGMDSEKLKEYCEQNSTNGIIEIANYNCPGQIVITGEAAVVSKAVTELVELGASRVIPLNVSGPFHSSLMQGAGALLEQELLSTELFAPTKKVISNYDNEYYGNDKNKIIYKLTKQISSSVRLEQNMRKFIEDGVNTFIEIGPGKVLTGFMRKIDKSIKVYSIDDMKTLEKAITELKGGN